MAFWYLDPSTGSNSNNATSWAQAYANLDDLLNSSTLGAGGTDSVGVGDTIFMRANTVVTRDTKASSRTFTFPDSDTNPVNLVGVLTGTTNEGTSITESDLATRGSQQPEVEATGAGNDISITCFNTSIFGIKFITADQMFHNTDGNYADCVFDTPNRIRHQGTNMRYRNCEFILAGGDFLQFQGPQLVEGGLVTYTGSPGTQNLLNTNPMNLQGVGEWRGVDLSDLPSGSNLVVPGSMAGIFRFVNCSLPATFNLVSGSFARARPYVELISSDSSTHTTSVQDYEYEDPYGSVVLDTTHVRTGGATDGAAGQFAYAMTPHSDSTKEWTEAELVSPWLSTWVAGDGVTSKTFTVYIANSTASTDYNEDEVWCEFYAPDDAGSAKHDVHWDPGNARFVNSSTAITDDTGSTWGSGANNHQKFSFTTTPDFEGWVYARIHLVKRQTTPDTLYLDPLIEVT